VVGKSQQQTAQIQHRQGFLQARRTSHIGWQDLAGELLRYFQFQGGQDHPAGSLSSQLIQRTCDFRSFSFDFRL
jgi:hypothetical protein